MRALCALAVLLAFLGTAQGEYLEPTLTPPTLSSPYAVASFGYVLSMSESGRWLAVGAPKSTSSSSEKGRVYVYEKNAITNAYSLVFEHFDNSLQDRARHGQTVAITDNGYMLVGSANRGVAFFYYDNSNGWTAGNRISTVGPAPTVSYGTGYSTVSISGTHAVLGGNCRSAYSSSTETSNDKCLAVYALTDDGFTCFGTACTDLSSNRCTFTIVKINTAPAPTISVTKTYTLYRTQGAAAYFASGGGYNRRVAVAADTAGTGGSENHNRMIYFIRSTDDTWSNSATGSGASSWSETNQPPYVVTPVPTRGSTNTRYFGVTALAMNANYVVVGDPYVGRVFVYSATACFAGGSGNLGLIPTSLHQGSVGEVNAMLNYFGRSVAILDAIIVVGAPAFDSYPSSGYAASSSRVNSGGSFSIFSYVSGKWVEMTQVYPRTPGENNLFGWSVAIGGSGGVYRIAASRFASSTTTAGNELAGGTVEIHDDYVCTVHCDALACSGTQCWCGPYEGAGTCPKEKLF